MLLVLRNKVQFNSEEWRNFSALLDSAHSTVSSHVRTTQHSKKSFGLTFLPTMGNVSPNLCAIQALSQS